MTQVIFGEVGPLLVLAGFIIGTVVGGVVVGLGLGRMGGEEATNTADLLALGARRERELSHLQRQVQTYEAALLQVTEERDEWRDEALRLERKGLRSPCVRHDGPGFDPATATPQEWLDEVKAANARTAAGVATVLVERAAMRHQLAEDMAEAQARGCGNE